MAGSTGCCCTAGIKRMERNCTVMNAYTHSIMVQFESPPIIQSQICGSPFISETAYNSLAVFSIPSTLIHVCVPVQHSAIWIPERQSLGTAHSDLTATVNNSLYAVLTFLLPSSSLETILSVMHTCFGTICPGSSTRPAHT